MGEALYYHISYIENVSSILEKGLVVGSSIERCRSPLFPEYDYIYLAKSKEDALQLAPPIGEYLALKHTGEQQISSAGAAFYEFETCMFRCACFAVDLFGEESKLIKRICSP